MPNLNLGLLLAGILCCNAAFGVDITNITNPGNYQQKTRTQKYTVGSDGVSLMYRNRDTGMRLSTAGTPGSEIHVMDANIPARVRNTGTTTGGTASSSVSGGTGGGSSGNISTSTQRQLGTSQVPPARQLTSGSSGSVSGGNTGGGKVTGNGVGSTVGKALGTLSGVLVVVDGAKNLSESVAGTEKATWKDVGRGALGGAETAGGATMIANAVGGTRVWIASIAAGAVIGAAGAGAEMFSETDCEMDPVLGKYACCNISGRYRYDEQQDKSIRYSVAMVYGWSTG